MRFKIIYNSIIFDLNLHCKLNSNFAQVFMHTSLVNKLNVDTFSLVTFYLSLSLR